MGFLKKWEAVKARLVARGFEEMLSDQVDVPAVSVTSLWLFFAIAAGCKWKIEALDI